MAIIFEDSAKVTKKQIPIPQNAKKVFKAMKTIYEPYLDKNVPGSKILKSLGSDKKYNKKGTNSKQNGENVKQDSVNVNDAKVRLHRMNKLNKNSIEYQLNGGELAANIYRKGIEQARGVKEVDIVKPPKPTTNADLKPSSIETKEINTPNGSIKYTVTTESKIIKESAEDFYEVMYQYDENYVYNQFLEDKDQLDTKVQDFGVLINPEMYVKALREFTKFGKLTTFPERYVYQWMGIIMKNTAILISNTNIAGHSSSVDESAMEDFINSYYGDGREIEVYGYNHPCKIELQYEEVIEKCEDLMIYIDEAVDKYGQTYLPWMSQSDIDRNVEKRDLELKNKRLQEKYGDILKYIEAYNERHDSDYTKDYLEFNEENGKVYWYITASYFLDLTGIYDWMQLPDGSDAISDFGIEPLLNVISEYNDNLPAEKVLVIVNKALDVYHQRGDLSSMFIQGGRKSLNRIAESVKKLNGKKVFITEAQLKNIVKRWQAQ